MAKITHCILSPEPVSFISIDNAQLGVTGDSTVCLGGYLDLNGSQQILDVGDLLHITIPEAGIDVELIVGSDPLTTFQNDIGANSWITIVARISNVSGSFSPADLLTNNYCFDFDKALWAFDSGNVGQGNSVELNWNNEVVDVSTGMTDVTTDLMPRWARVTADNTQGRVVSTTPIVGAAAQGVIGTYPDAFALDTFGIGGGVWTTNNALLPGFAESNCNGVPVRQFFTSDSNCLTGRQVVIREYKYWGQPAVTTTSESPVTVASDDRPALTAAMNALPGAYNHPFGNFSPFHGTWFIQEKNTSDPNSYCSNGGTPFYLGGPFGYYGNYWLSDGFLLPLVDNIIEYVVFEVLNGTCAGTFWKFEFRWTVEY